MYGPRLPWVCMMLLLPITSVISVDIKCSDLSQCPAKADDKTTLTCWGGKCNMCSPVTNGDVQYPTADAGSNDCFPVCSTPLTVAGKTECQTIASLFDAAKRLYCQDILNIKGYSSSPATYIDSSGDKHTFTGVCYPCKEGERVNAKGNGCEPIPSPPPPPPSSPPPPKAPPPEEAADPPPSKPPSKPPPASAQPTTAPPFTFVAKPPPPQESAPAPAPAPAVAQPPDSRAFTSTVPGIMTLVVVLVATFATAAMAATS